MNNPRIAKFEKISFPQFQNDCENLQIKDIETCYENIRLPERATNKSAAYDFATPYDFVLQPKDSILIRTGIRCKMNENYVLILFPRSSIGIKHRISLTNTAGVVDADYYDTDNEGHIMLALTNNGSRPFLAEAGTRIAQGIFLPYGITEDDDADNIRMGGFGSTGI